jgi:hypothetical protein
MVTTNKLNWNMTQGFIKQTAHDYDMPVREVERIAKLFPNDFYAKLEEHISDRAKR